MLGFVELNKASGHVACGSLHFMHTTFEPHLVVLELVRPLHHALSKALLIGNKLGHLRSTARVHHIVALRWQCAFACAYGVGDGKRSEMGPWAVGERMIGWAVCQTVPAFRRRTNSRGITCCHTRRALEEGDDNIVGVIPPPSKPRLATQHHA